jgi:site-specific DNA recombinase
MPALKDNYNINNRIYKVGIYVRLSREDDKEYKNGDSESIQNQKEFVTNYVIEKGWNIVDIYSDDGFTGTNFDRPGFCKLIQDINNRKINMVITKDLSRLGRDYIGTGHYLERYFPENNVRYIAINDGIDTYVNNSNNDMSPFRSVMNDMYAKDISRKVRSVMDTKREMGKFIGAFAPYGYKKSAIDKNILVIDEEAAKIVKNIFHMFTLNIGYTAIAEMLNKEGNLCPSAYKKQQNSNYNNPKVKLNLWTQETVKSILMNPTYIGNLAQNKYSKVNYKVKRLRVLSKNDWIIIKNTHEPIVDKETFDRVQNIVKSKSNMCYSHNAKIHLLTGLIFCGDCGERMTYSKTIKGLTYCICSKYKRFKTCTRHSISEGELEKSITNELKKISAFSADEEKLLNISKIKSIRTNPKDVSIQIKGTEEKLQYIKRAIKSLYEDKLKGIITEDDFIDLSEDYSNDRVQLNKSLEDLIKRKSEFNELYDETKKLVKFIKAYTDFDYVDNNVLKRLIHKIEIFENKEIVIHYKFKNPISG